MNEIATYVCTVWIFCNAYTAKKYETSFGYILLTNETDMSNHPNGRLALPATIYGQSTRAQMNNVIIRTFIDF